MSTKVQRILTAVRALSAKDRQELARALEREALTSPVPAKADLIRAVRGKYASVPTSSDAFIARKHEELTSEH